MDVNDILKVYLGTDETGGYQPIGVKERFRKAFPDDFEEREKEIEKYLNFEPRLDWRTNTPSAACVAYSKDLEKAFPELDHISIRALTNMLSYDLR